MLTDNSSLGPANPNDLVWGLDTHTAVKDEPSVFDSIANVVTKGVPLTGLSIVNSFSNTAVDIANFFGGEYKRATIEEQVGEGELLDYYREHQQGIEAAGLIVGSLLPGSVAVKALKLAQAGAPTSALTRATGIFSAPRQRIIDNALKEINAGDAALYGALNADKLKAIALGYGDQALQALVYEVATVATMKASPLLDADGFKDTLTNMFFGAMLGGGIGGTIEAIGTRAIINKALLNRDIDTKFAEMATYLEGSKGSAFGAGDKVVALLDSIDSLPVRSSDPLIAKKASQTYDAAILNSKKILNSLVGKEDHELTNSMFDVLMRMKNEGNLSKEEMYDYFARLARVSRIGDPPSTPAGKIFYVNNFAKDANFVWDDLVTNLPNDAAAVSRAYQLRPYATSPKVARFDDSVEIAEGLTVPRYRTVQEAWDDGADMFVGKGKGGKLQIYVNDNGPNIMRVARPGESRPLTIKEEKLYRETGKLPETSRDFYSAPIILNTRTGAVKESAVPVVGDFGTPKLLDDGLSFGGKFSKQSLAAPIDAETSTLDANARYVWINQRGLQRGDSIANNDIAALEQVYRDLEKMVSKDVTWEQAVEKFSKKGITVNPDVPLIDADKLLTYIRDQKDTLIAALLQKDAKLTADDIALRANVPVKYLESNLASKSAKDFIVDPAEHARVNHVQLEYDINNINTIDGQIARGLIDVNYRIGVVKRALDAQGAKFFGEDFQKFKASGLSSDSNIEGVGAGAFSFSNAGYNTLGQQMERIGRHVTDLITKRMAAVSDKLAAVTNDIRSDPALANELGNFIQVRRMTNESYSFIPRVIADAEGLSPDTVVLSKSIVTMRDGTVKWLKDYTPEGFVPFAKAQQFPESEGLRVSYQLSPKVAAFERANMEVNNARIAARNGFYQANGITRTLESDRLYAPPIDTKKYPHFALVKARPGTGMADDSVAIITAKDAADLEQKIAALSDDFSVYTKQDLKKHHEVQGDYEFGRNFLQTEVNSALQRRGILNNVFPETRAESIVRDYIDWHSKQETRLIRDHVELINGQLFAELRAIGERFASAEMSKTGLTLKDLGRTAKNPYDDYVKTALGISTKEEYRLWSNSNDTLEAFFSTAFNAAKTAFLGAHRGLISYEEAAATSRRFGLGNVYEKATDALKAYTDVANKLPPERYLSKFVAAGNSILAATAIRLDAFQSLINVISTPVLLLPEAAAARRLLETELPDGTGRMIPASTKVLYEAVGNYFDKAHREKWMTTYKELGAVRNRSSEYFEMIEELTLPYGKLSESESIAKIKRAADLGAKLTGSERAEEFVRFVAADAGRQIFEAAGYSGQKLTDNIITFVNRVHGNYIASQRPVAFQGPVGQAIGLFQTYQFNLFQQLFRHIENREAKTVAIMAGMQTTLFGMQGLPGFQAINNHIIGNASNNPAHKDAYSTVPSFFDKKLGDYLLYGVTSNWLNTGLYSRGDINPRQITILPTNPLDFPAIAGGIKLVGNLLDVAGNIAKGGNIPASLMLGLEHNGLSRPLTGLAQLSQGFATTSQGSLIATTRPPTTNGMSDLVDIANVSRLLGARPLDEAIVMDALYRKTLYSAKDAQRIRALGEAVKSHMYGGSSPTPEETENFARAYQASGGQQQMFARKMMEWSLDANSSVANQLYRNLKLPMNQQIQVMMGGVPLPDFANQEKEYSRMQPNLAAPAVQ